MRASNSLRACLRQAEVLYFALLDQLADSSSDVLNWNVRVNAVLIEKINAIGAQALEGGIRNLTDPFGTAVESLPARASIRVEIETKFGGNYDLVANRLQGFAKKILVGEGAVDLSSIEESDAPINGAANQLDHFVPILRGSVREAHAHAAKAERRYFKIAFAEFPLFHCTPKG